VSWKSIKGEITLEKAKGRVEVRAVNEGIRLADVSADLSAESTNGSIILDRVDSANVDLYTVNGNISYDGPIKDKGLYRLTTHNGMIAIPVPERANDTVTARTYTGGTRPTSQLPADPAGAERRSKRLTLTVGNGSAHVELESFGGTISLRRPGEARPETERKRNREKDKDIGLAGRGIGRGVGGGIGRGLGIGLRGIDGFVDPVDIQAQVERAMAGVQPEIDRAIAEAQPEIDRAIAEAQPEIDRAVNDAVRELGPDIERAMNDAMVIVNDVVGAIAMPHVMPMPNPMPVPVPLPAPRRR